MEKKIRTIDTHYKGPETDDAWVEFTPSAAVMVTCIDNQGKPNILPLVGWGVLSRFPLIIGIAVCHDQYTKNYFKRYSHDLLLTVPEFVLNIPHEGLRESISVCGSCSGDKMDKFSEAHLTPMPSTIVRPPVIAECPVNIECKVINVVRAGSHDIFLGEGVAVHSAIKHTEIDEEMMVMTLYGDEAETGQTPDGVSKRQLLWRTLPWWSSGNAEK
jgi:flavin reductase (DIM6/NTAB) family NADH-FMN oxidoreductase RutF